MRLLPILSAVLVLEGCQGNPYKSYYHQQQDIATLPSYVPSKEPLKIYTTNNAKIDSDIDGLMKASYARVGYSSFNGNAAKVSEKQLREQAKEVSAVVVLLNSQYTGTVTGAVPLTLPTVQTSYTTGTATAYGGGGSATAYGNSTTTTYGSETTMMPYSIQRADFGAVYFVKVKQRAGILAVPLDDAGHKKLGTNGGLLVKIVVTDSTAFQADVFPGDIMMGADNDRFTSTDNYKVFLDTHMGKSAVFHFIRDEKPIEKTIRIKDYSEP